MNYDNWKTTNRDDWQLGTTSTDFETAWGTEQPSKVEAELNQAEWYRTIYLPAVRAALRGERVDRALLEGGTDQANDDQNWDSHTGEDWS